MVQHLAPSACACTAELVVRTLGCLPELVQQTPLHVGVRGRDAVAEQRICQLIHSISAFKTTAEWLTLCPCLQAELVVRMLGSLPELVQQMPPHVVVWGRDAV